MDTGFNIGIFLLISWLKVPPNLNSKVKEEGMRRRLKEELILMKVQSLYQAASRDNLLQALHLLQGTRYGTGTYLWCQTLRYIGIYGTRYGTVPGFFFETGPKCNFWDERHFLSIIF